MDAYKVYIVIGVDTKEFWEDVLTVCWDFDEAIACCDANKWAFPHSMRIEEWERGKVRPREWTLHEVPIDEETGTIHPTNADIYKEATGVVGERRVWDGHSTELILLGGVETPGTSTGRAAKLSKSDGSRWLREAADVKHS